MMMKIDRVDNKIGCQQEEGKRESDSRSVSSIVDKAREKCAQNAWESNYSLLPQRSSRKMKSTERLTKQLFSFGTTLLIISEAERA
jgi:cellobiose phosphorylase